MCIFHLLFPIKEKEFQRWGIQLIREIPHGKHIWPAVPSLYCGALNFRHGCQIPLTWILHFRLMDLGRDVWVRYELERGLKNSGTQLPEKICWYLRGNIKIIARTLLESSYDFTMTLITNTDAEISILLCQGFLDKNIFSLLSNYPRQVLMTYIELLFWGGTSWVLPLWKRLLKSYWSGSIAMR